MPIVRIEHAVPDFERWKRAFDSDPADRRGSGVRRYQVARRHDDPSHVTIDLVFDTIEAAEAFLRKMERIWDGPGGAVMNGPRTRILDLVESAELV
jgi:hypothetical protein